MLARATHASHGPKRSPWPRGGCRRRLRFHEGPVRPDHRKVAGVGAPVGKLRRREVVNDPAYGADEAVDGEADDRDFHDAHQHDGEVAVSDFPQA
jgi:hypothetical protein